MKERTNERTFI